MTSQWFVGHLDVLGLRDVIRDVLVPFGEIDEIAFFVGFVGFAVDFDGGHECLLGDLKGIGVVRARTGSSGAR